MRSNRTEALIPELERSLAAGAAGQGRESRLATMRRLASARPSRVAAVAATCLAFGGSAMAATGVWNPTIGSSNDPVAISNTPVPAELTAHLGVLRADQTDQDRSPAVEATLNGGEAPDGVRLDSVRYLAPGANGEAVVLLSGTKAAYYETENEPLCLVRPALGDSHASSLCFDLSMLMSDHARVLEQVLADGTGTAYGLVPDGVATVTVPIANGPDRTATVHNNYWELPSSGAELAGLSKSWSASQTVWRDADGNVVPQQSPES